MTPRPSRHLPPFFHEIEWKPFQKMCGELLSHEAGVEKADEFGTQGQGQRGVDLLASIPPKHVAVGQCKCEAKFSVKKIQKASQEFFKHWSYWKDKGVHRFILFIACDASRAELQEEELRQKKRFREKGIAYAIWGAATLRTKLRPHRAIARTYIDAEEIVDDICGPAGDSTVLSAALTAATQRLGVFSVELDEAQSRDLDELRELSRLGDISKALAGAVALQVAPSWPDRTAKFRSRVIRFEAAMHLNLRHDVRQAEGLIAEARTLDPSGDYQVIDAYMAYCEGGPEKGLDALPEASSADARNMRWSLLLEAGRLDTLDNEIAQAKFPLDAEANRILAILALVRGDLSGAKVAVAKASEAAGKRPNIRNASAMVKYFTALSPAAEGWKRLAWAVPVSWSFVKQDSGSIEALNSAEQEFVSMCDLPDCLPAQREGLRVWRLACLACVDSRQEEAAALAKKMLESDADAYGAVAWALHRGYPFDVNSVREALLHRISTEPDNIELRLAHLALLSQEMDLKRGEAAVDEGEDAFKRTGNRDLWLVYKVQFVAGHGDLPNAKALAATIVDLHFRRSADLAILRAGLSAPKGREAMADRLKSDFETTGDLRQLYECCELKLWSHDFKFVSENARKLVSSIGTASALRLALDGAFKNGDYSLCLELLQEFRHLLRGGLLSPDVRNLMVICQYKLGDWPAAAQEADRLYREQRNLPAFDAYFEVLVRSGDTRRCCDLARELLGFTGVKPVQYLRAARMAMLHDAELAKKLWQLANRRLIKDLELGGISLNLAFELGLSREAAPLLERLSRAAHEGKGPLRPKTLDETIALIREQFEAARRVSKLYEEGAMPIHLISDARNVPLSLIYHERLEANRRLPNFVSGPVLFARSGVREIQPGLPRSVFADITSLILGEDLGILDKVEETFGPIYIAPSITQSLLDQVSRLRPSQPEIHESRKKLLEMASAGHIEVVGKPATLTFLSEELRSQLGSEYADLFQHAADRRGFVIHDGPFLAEGALDTTVQLTSAAEALVKWPCVLVTDKPGSRGSSGPSVEVIADGTAVLLPHATVVSLSANQIDDAVRRFRLIVSENAVQQIKTEIQEFDNRTQIAQWTQALLDRINRGIAARYYRVAQTDPARDNSTRDFGVTSRTLLDALVPIGLPDGVIWCDDRSVNCFLNVGSRVVVGISEIIGWLKGKNALSAAEAYAALLRLRQGNVRYLPLVEGEVEFHLEAALCEKGHLVETPALTILRRYVNGCMLDRERLQAPQLQGAGQVDLREFGFALGLRRTIEAALRNIWNQHPAPDAVLNARSDWLYDNIYLEYVGLRQALMVGTSPGDVRSITAMTIAGLYGEGVGLTFRSEKEGTLSPRRRFFGWLNKRLLEPLKERDPSMVSEVSRALGVLVASLAADDKASPGAAHSKEERIWWAFFLRDLPDELQFDMNLPTEIRARLGVTEYGPSVGFGNRVYERTGYWRAIADAVNGREGRVESHAPKRLLTCKFARKETDGRITLELESPDFGEHVEMSDAALQILSDSIEDRLVFLRSHPDWFDCKADEREESILSISGSENAANRIEAVNRWREGSAEMAYLRIEALISDAPRFNRADLTIPDWERLLRHLHIDPGDGLAAAAGLSTAAETLASGEGMAGSLRRLICLPVKLPRSLEEKWQALDTGEANALYAELLNKPHSLVGDLHLIRLAGLRDSPEFWAQAELVASGLIGPAGRSQFNSFRALLRFAESQFFRWAKWRGLPAWMRLVCIWYHASRLHGCLRASAEDPKRLLEWLGHNTETLTEETIACDPDFWYDINRPNRVTFGGLILHGLAHLAGSFPLVRERLGTPLKLETFLATEEKGGLAIQVDQARRAAMWPDNLGSFASRATQAEFEAVFGTDLAGKLFGVVTDEQLREFVDALAKKPDDSGLWITLNAVVGDGQLPAEISAAMREILRAVTFGSLVEADGKALGATLLAACRQAQRCGDKGVITHLEGIILGITGRLKAAREDDETGLQPAMSCLEALLLLAVVPGDEEQSSRHLFDLLKRFSVVRPDIAASLSSVPRQWANRLPYAQQVNLWPFIYTIRSLR